MNNAIGNNSFYNTFTPFINEKTRTAEKTMSGSSSVIPKETPKKTKSIGKTFYKYVSAGGFLLIPILALAASRVHLNRMMRKLDIEYFLAVNNEFAGGFLKGISKKLTMAKYGIVNGIAKVLKPLRVRKDLFFHKLNSKSNKSFLGRTIRNINQFFKNQRAFAMGRIDKRVKADFDVLERKMNTLLDVIKKSDKGSIKVVVHKMIAKNPADELPRAIDLSKTLSGKNRAAEIKLLMDKIKNYLKAENPDYANIVKRITYSCEDVFEQAQNSLVLFRKYIKKKHPGDLNKSRKIIKHIFDDLIRYRYAEKIDTIPRCSPMSIRKIHLKNALSNLELLKKNVSDDRITAKFLADFEKILTENADPGKMGLIEKIRQLLKCNDMRTGLLKKGIQASMLKQYRPDDYIEIKKYLTDFAKTLKQAEVSKKYMLPTYLAEIDRGKVFTNTLATVVPAGVLAANYYLSDKDKVEHKRNFFSFIAGTAVMMGTHHFAICSRIKSIIAGLITAYLTAKVYDRLPKSNLEKNS